MTRTSATQPHDAERDVEEPLHARVASRVHLADVEQQRHALELGDRELAQPLLVEQRERADPHARPRAASTPAHDVVVGSAPRDRARRPSRAGSRDSSSGRRVGTLVDAASTTVSDPTTVPLRSGARVQLPFEVIDLVGLGDDDHPVARVRPDAAVAGHRGAEHVPRHQHDRAPEHDEARQRARRRRGAARARSPSAAVTVAPDRAPPCGTARRRLLGKPERVGGQRQEQPRTRGTTRTATTRTSCTRG